MRYPAYNHTRGDSGLTPCAICMLIELVEEIRLEPDCRTDSDCYQSLERELLIKKADAVIAELEAHG